MNCRNIALALLMLFWGNVAGAQSAKPPIKITVEPLAQSIHVGQKAVVTISLRDVDNRFTPASKLFIISVEVQPPSGPTQTQSLSIGIGQSRHELSLNLTQPGIVRVTAKESELRQGEALINVQPLSARSRRLASLVREDVHGGHWGAPPLDSFAAALAPVTSAVSAFVSAVMLAAPMVRDELVSENAGRFLVGLERSSPPLTQPVLPPAAGSAPTAPPQLILDITTTPPLADGKDAATVVAFLSRPAEQDTVLNFFSDGGYLSQSKLKVPKGADTATCTLTSQRVGTVQIRYLGSDPPVALDPSSRKTLTVKFAPPIINFVVRSSPPRVSLLDQAYFDVQLVDEHSRPIAADTKRQVSFVMDNGNGEITPVMLSIPAGSFESRAVFLPNGLGPVQVTASMLTMPSQSTRIDVNLPLVLLALSLLGGLLGGGIAYLFGRDKKLKYWRIAVGAVTGFVFYWLCLYLGLGHLAHTVILNPLNACTLSILGGWFGTAVFDVVGKQLNLLSAKRTAP